MHLADTFIQSDLQCIQDIYFLSVCVGIEPTTFALLTQCSTTEPQEHYITHRKIYKIAIQNRLIKVAWQHLQEVSELLNVISDLCVRVVCVY